MNRYLLAGASLAVLASAAVAAPSLPKDASVWPNAWSRANSDDWLSQHHDEIRTLRPRVLVLHYANNKTADQARKQVDDFITIFREASRYHGYKDPNTPPALDFQVAKLVDLTDRPDPRPEDQRLDGNSTAFPRFEDTERSWGNFVYSDLYTQRYAAHYGYRDPRNKNRFLTLEDLVNQGEVNEVWILARHGNFGSPFEGIEVKQVYDENFRKIPGLWRQAGNGGTDAQPWIGRSLRIMFMNTDRGPGCFLESHGHSIEHVATQRIIPYFTKYFREFANLDWDERHGLRSHSLYGHSDDPIDYPDPSTITFKNNGQPFKIENYDARGGNVHFNPSGRRDYDLTSPFKVNSSIEHYRLGDGPDGKDIVETWDVSRFDKYRSFAPDCMGPWLVYWYQNYPGNKSPAKDDNGQPMKSWWPFLYY